LQKKDGFHLSEGCVFFRNGESASFLCAEKQIRREKSGNPAIADERGHRDVDCISGEAFTSNIYLLSTTGSGRESKISADSAM
jgi:hypothetical protein